MFKRVHHNVETSLIVLHSSTIKCIFTSVTLCSLPSQENSARADHAITYHTGASLRESFIIYEMGSGVWTHKKGRGKTIWTFNICDMMEKKVIRESYLKLRIVPPPSHMKLPLSDHHHLSIFMQVWLLKAAPVPVRFQWFHGPRRHRFIFAQAWGESHPYTLCALYIRHNQTEAGITV